MMSLSTPWLILRLCPDRRMCATEVQNRRRAGIASAGVANASASGLPCAVCRLGTAGGFVGGCRFEALGARFVILRPRNTSAFPSDLTSNLTVMLRYGLLYVIDFAPPHATLVKIGLRSLCTVLHARPSTPLQYIYVYMFLVYNVLHSALLCRRASLVRSWALTVWQRQDGFHQRSSCGTIKPWEGLCFDWCSAIIPLS